MLSKLYIKNFLSFRDIAIEFGKLNVFIGPNGSGKSNLAKALRLLRNHFVYGLPILDESLPSEYLFGDMVYGFDVYKVIEFEAILNLNGEEVVYVLKLSKDGYEEKMLKRNEVIYEGTARIGVSAGVSFRYKDRNGVLREIVGMGYQNIIIVLRDLEGRVERASTNIPISPLRNPPTDADEALHKATNFFRNIGVFRLDPDVIRLRSAISAEPTVRYNGSNLARYILHLYLEKRKVFASLEEVVKSLVPEVDEIVPHIEGNEVEIWLKSKYLSLPLRPSFISDGMLRLMAIASILNTGFSLVAIEEPENHVHPYLLEALIDLARKSSSQIVFTTHSPHLLDYLEPNEVYVVGRTEVGTRIMRLTDVKDFEIVKKFLEEGGTLGEAWISRFFGGIE